MAVGAAGTHGPVYRGSAPRSTDLYPLSSAHYIELNKIADAGKRGALGALMFDLPRAVTILPHARACC